MLSNYENRLFKVLEQNLSDKEIENVLKDIDEVIDEDAQHYTSARRNINEVRSITDFNNSNALQ